MEQQSRQNTAAPERMKLFSDGMRGKELALLYGAIWALAWPSFFGQGIRSVMMFIIRVIVGQMGEKAYNGINIGLMIFMIIITVIAAVAVGTTALVAQSWGSGDREKAGRILQQSLVWGALLSVLIGVAGIPASRLLYKMLGADSETIEHGVTFLVWLFAAVPFLSPGFFLAAGLTAAGDARTPMVGGAIMAVVSVFLSYGLILGKFGMPELGSLGAALALDLSFACFTLFLAVLFIANKTVLKLPLRGWRLDTKIGFSMFRIGLPSAMEWILIQAGILIYVVVIYRYGDEPAAGYFTGLAILVFAQTPAYGFQTAAATLVGQAVGARDHARAESVFRHCSMMGFIFMALVGVILFLGVNQSFLTILFSKLSPDSIRYARTFIVLLIFAMPIMGISFSMGGGLRGAGDTVPPLIAAAVGVYGGRILFAFVIYAVFKPPVAIIWCTIFPDLVLRIIVMAIRLKSGKWKKARV